MKPPTFIECTVCGREFGSKSIVIHERQCLQKLRRTEICEDETPPPPTGQGKNRKKKKVPQELAVSMPTKERSPSTSPSPSGQILLPKIQTKFSNSSKNLNVTRPSTATLSKPKFLDLNNIGQDMSLTRIDYTTPQLRVMTVEDLNQNPRSSRSNVTLPVMYYDERKFKQTSSPTKFEANGRQSGVKLPDSRTNFAETGKPMGVEFSANIALPLNSGIPISSDFHLLMKSQSLPFLPLCLPQCSSDILMKEMEPIEKSFPQITNDRSPAQPTSSADVTFTSLPKWDDAKGCSILGKDYSHPRSHSKEIETEEEPRTSEERIKNLKKYEPIPETIFLRNLDSFAALSEQSFGTLKGSYEALVIKALSCGRDEYLSRTVAGMNETAPNDAGVITQNEFTLDRKAEALPCPHQRTSSAFLPPNDTLNSESGNTVSFATPICINMDQNLPSPGDWTFGDFYTKPASTSPKSILKSGRNSGQIGQNCTSDGIAELFRSPGVYSASSGSDCDNEGTSSGYGFFRAVSSHTILRKRKNRQSHQSHSAPQGVIIFDGVPLASNSDPSTPSTDFVNERANIGDGKNFGGKNVQSRPSKLTSYEKVNHWLEKCSNRNEESEQDTSESPHQPSTSKTSTSNLSEAEIILPSSSRTESEHSSSKRGVSDNPKKITGRLSATFKVMEEEATLLYKFVNEMQIKRKSRISVPKKKSPKFFGKSKTNSHMFYCYQPPKHLVAAKGIAEVLKKFESGKPSHSVRKRPQTAASEKFFFPYNKLFRPETVKFEVKPKTFLHHKKVTTSETVPKPPMSPPKELNKENQKLVFGPQSNPGTVQAHPSSRVPPGSDSSSKKIRPSTPRPRCLSFEDITSSPRSRTKKTKLNKSSQAPETRSTCVQHSPVILKKPKLSRPKHNFGTDAQGDKKMKSSSDGHQIYQFHSHKKFGSSPDFSVKFGDELLDTNHGNNENEGAFFDGKAQGKGLKSTYTLLIPRNLAHNQDTNLNVLIRRCGTGSRIEIPTESVPSQMYLIIDEMELPAPDTSTKIEDELWQGDCDELHAPGSAAPEPHSLSQGPEFRFACNKDLNYVQQNVNPAADDSFLIVSSRSITAEAETQTPRSNANERNSHRSNFPSGHRSSGKLQEYKSFRVNNFPSFFPLL